MMKKAFLALMMAGVLLLSGCGSDSRQTRNISESPATVPNVATEFCLENGYQLTITADASGTTAHCLFPDGSRCDLWAFYHGECTEPVTP